jgi:hypothetical protein
MKISKLHKNASIDFQRVYEPDDRIEVVAPIFDFDTGDLRVPKGTQGVVIGMDNPEYIHAKLETGEFFHIYILCARRIYKNEFEAGDRVESCKDIYDQLSHKVIIPCGEEGVVESIKGGEWIRVLFNCHDNESPIGVHLSEIKRYE